MNFFEYSISLGIHHKNLDLSDIFNGLKIITWLTPGRIWKAGEQRQTPKGLKLEGFYDSSYCYFDLVESWKNDNEDPLLELIEKLFNDLAPFKNMFRNFNSEGGSVDVRVAIHVVTNSGMMMPVDLIKKFTDFGVGLWFDFYPQDKARENQ